MEREIAMAPKQNKMTWLDWVQNILIISAVVIFTLNYTIVGVLRGGWFSPLKNLVMIGIFLLFVYRFFTVSKEERRQWFTQKFLRVPSFVWLLAYFIVRCICFAVNGFQYGIAREIFFEFVFLVAICPWTVGPRVRFDIIAWVFCGINLVMNLANTCCCHVLKVFFAEGGSEPVNGGILGFLTHLKSFSPDGIDVNLTPMYSNPNSAGIMTGMAILLSFLLVRRNKASVLFIVYWCYCLYGLYSSESRGAMVSFVVAIICFILWQIGSQINIQRFVIICLIACSVLTITIYGFIGYNLRDGDGNFTEVETKIDSLSSGRYYIWQTSYRSQQDMKLFGVGNATRESKIRNQLLLKDHIGNYGSDVGFVSMPTSIHNGYLATVFIAGWSGFILFIIVLMDKLKQAGWLKESNNQVRSFAAILIFSLVINNFEALLITSRYFSVFIMFLILAYRRRERKGC